ncbi:TonB-dependent receptor [Oxalicibacterium faecigallinarum]|uniref:TonB-dependent receptor n=1 Tax=Oxalicibacterium faecigallinarum TaxID=573741 RepID=UPI001667152D|nr:TonB-dependent receptor [Oxalicibacterium faecigallinarum]
MAVRSALLSLALGASSLAFAQAPSSSSSTVQAEVRQFNISAGPIAQVLGRFAAEAGVTLSFDASQLGEVRSNGLSGTHTISNGFARILSDSGFEATETSAGRYVLRRVPAGVTTLPAVQVAAQAASNDLPQTYAGGQVARGSRLGMLGNTSIMDTPFNTTSYTAELIENQQARNLIDVLVNDPSVADAGGRTFDNFFMRGFLLNREEIGFDGLYGIASAEGNLLQGVERVEVLKGPTTLVNGASSKGAAGGAINLVPKRAGETPLTRVTGTYLSDGNLGTHVDVGRRFGENNEFGARVNMAYRDGDSPVDYEKQRASLLTVGLDYRGDRLRLSGDFGSSRQRIDQDKPTFLVNSTEMPTAPSGKRNVAQPWNFQDKEHDFAVLKGEFDLTQDLTVAMAYGQAESRRDRVDNFPTIQDAQGTVTGSAYGLRSRTETESGQASLRWKTQTGSIGHQVVLSVSDFESKLYEYQQTLPYNFTSNLYNPVYNDGPGGISFNGPTGLVTRAKMRSYAIADTLSMLNDRLLLTIGARHQSIKVNTYDRSEVTPAIAAVFKYSPTTSLYANYVEALSQGTIAPPGRANAGDVFPPFVSKQQEVGIKNEWRNWTTTLSLFQIERPSAYTDAGNVYRVDGEQRNRGFELQVFGEPVKGWRVLGGAAWTHARMLKTQDGLNDGRQAEGAPKLQVRMGSEWDVTSVPGLTTSARVLYTSSQPVKVENTIRIPSWTRLDLGARYATTIGNKPVQLRAMIENVTDRRYWDAVPAFWVVSSAAPRTIMLSASVDF